MALLFSNVAEEYVTKMRNVDEEDSNTLSSKVSALFDELDSADDEISSTTVVGDETKERVYPQKMFMASVATQYYKKSIEDISNTKIGNKSVRRKNLQQVMKESFFYGANRFGTNFIA